MDENENKEFDLKNWAKHFLPAILALVIAATAWFDSNSSINEKSESFDAYKTKVNMEIEQLKLYEAELKGELRSQREMITDLRIDIREIKTILENIVRDKRKLK